MESYFGYDAQISIHSLVKRETTAADNHSIFHRDFNPLPRKEGDRKFR